MLEKTMLPERCRYWVDLESEAREIWDGAYYDGVWPILRLNIEGHRWRSKASPEERLLFGCTGND